MGNRTDVVLKRTELEKQDRGVVLISDALNSNKGTRNYFLWEVVLGDIGHEEERLSLASPPISLHERRRIVYLWMLSS